MRVVRLPRALVATGAVFILGAGAAAGSVLASSAPQDITCTITDSVLTCPLPQAAPVTSTVTETATETTTETATATVTQTETLPPVTTTVTAPPVTTTQTQTVTTTVTAPPVTKTQTVTVTATPSSSTTTPTPSTTTTAPVQTKNCAPKPSACGFPDATNTGTTGTLVAAACPGTVGDNAVIENKSFTNCSFTITGKNVVVRNVKLTSSSVAGWGIKVDVGATASFSNVDIGGVSASQPVQYAILYLSHSAGIARGSIDKAHIHDCIDCISADNTDITNSYFHAMRHPAGAHIDPIQCGAGDGCGLLVRHNTVFNEYSSTSAVAFFADFGVPRNSTIDNNLLAGGGYVITGGDGASGGRYAGQSSGIRITNNRFAKILYPYNSTTNCTDPNLHGCYGDITEWRPSSTNIATGNVDDATGNPITF